MVYGFWGCLDMVLFLFIKVILEGKFIDVFNYGNYWRDFIYVDDIVEGVVCMLDNVVVFNLNWIGDKFDFVISKGLYCLYNIGSNQLIELLCYIEVLEECFGKKVEKNLLFM